LTSPAFRRLQGKTQIFGLERNDFVRTRLTHSLETADIAAAFGRWLLRRHIALGPSQTVADVSEILAAAALVHDLGNPPFGHQGEAVIRRYFQEFFARHAGMLDPEEQADFIQFDGNPQTFRVLTKLQGSAGDVGPQGQGYNLTVSVLAATIKYPWPAYQMNRLEKGPQKFGYFASEAAEAQRVLTLTGQNDHRHPLVLLVDAADEIAYTAADLEDGVNMGVLPFESLQKAFERGPATIRRDLAAAVGKNRGIVTQALHQGMQNYVEYAMDAVQQVFWRQRQAIMQGGYLGNLLQDSAAAPLHQALRAQIAQNIHAAEMVRSQEIKEQQMIYTILDHLIPSAIAPDFLSPRAAYVQQVP
ncbi:MAG: dNTP triphosphohydrolase, partial [Firmicutes bacterium]|nr:dNTP triphosphohydrolase [Bacillota bacterium]